MMMCIDDILKRDIKNVFEDHSFINQLKNSVILVTGATGLIGSTLVKTLLYANQELDANIEIYALIRNRYYAERLFGSFDLPSRLKYVECDITENEPLIDGKVDYIVHGASITDSRMFVEKPVETINTGILGTENILNFSKKKQVKSIVYLSSMEVYGNTDSQKSLTESDIGYINPLSVRSCYSESKRMIENICIAFASEYHLPIKIIRLAQTFGPGVKYDDGRVFAEFARCVIEKRNIQLLTTGKSERMYLYTIDAVSAILTVLFYGENSNAYNAANKNTYCSINWMAELVARVAADGVIQVVLPEESKNIDFYLPEHHLYLDTTKLENLGWSAKVGLVEMYIRMIDHMKIARKMND